jgi:hypothetical protein
VISHSFRFIRDVGAHAKMGVRPVRAIFSVVPKAEAALLIVLAFVQVDVTNPPQSDGVAIVFALEVYMTDR